MSSPGPGRTPISRRSCFACRRRKIKCSRGNPCTYCAKFQFDCTYPSGTVGPKVMNGADLPARLQSIEASLHRIESERQNSDATNAALILTSAAESPNPGISQNDNIIHPGRSTPDGDPVRHGINDTRNEYSESAENQTEDQSAPSRVDGLPVPIPAIDPPMFLFNRSTESIELLHPEKIRIFGLWQIYLDSVDPLIKILHVPTVQRQLLTASQNLSQIPLQFECLMFAIYYAAVTSLQTSVSSRTMGSDELAGRLARYQLGLEKSLIRCNVISAPSVMTLQALTLYLACARSNIDKSYVWSMVSLLVRLAMKIGLHHEPSSLDSSVSPYNSEIRRRLWWQIYTLDVQTAEDNDTGSLICDHVHDTHYPANVHDSELDVSMSQIPNSASKSHTAMLFSLATFDIAILTRSIRTNLADDPLAQPPVLRSHFDEILNRRLEGCDKGIPICQFINYVVSYSELKLGFKLSSMPEVLDAEYINGAISVGFRLMGYIQACRKDTKYSRWIWLIQKELEWETMAHVFRNMNMEIDPPFVGLSNDEMATFTEFFEYWASRVYEGDSTCQGLLAERRKMLDSMNMQTSAQDA